MLKIKQFTYSPAGLPSKKTTRHNHPTMKNLRKKEKTPKNNLLPPFHISCPVSKYGHWRLCILTHRNKTVLDCNSNHLWIHLMKCGCILKCWYFFYPQLFWFFYNVPVCFLFVPYFWRAKTRYDRTVIFDKLAIK